jgi:hypothetical protein
MDAGLAVEKVVAKTAVKPVMAEVTCRCIHSVHHLEGNNLSAIPI